MTSRGIMFLGSRDPYKPSFATVTGKGPPPNNIHVKHISEKKRLFSISKWDFGTPRWLSSELTDLLPTSGDWFCQLLYWWISERLYAAGTMVKPLGMVSEDF